MTNCKSEIASLLQIENYVPRFMLLVTVQFRIMSLQDRSEEERSGSRRGWAMDVGGAGLGEGEEGPRGGKGTVHTPYQNCILPSACKNEYTCHCLLKLCIKIYFLFMYSISFGDYRNRKQCTYSIILDWVMS